MTEPFHADNLVTLHHGDCLAHLRDMPDNSVDAIVTDPPYGLSNTGPDKVADTIVRWASGDREHVPEGRGFMGRPWDAFVPPPAVWDECLRVLKPGGHMAVFAGSRTQDLMGMSIRLAGFELRDSLAWIYGSGMPKSMDVSKAIDKEANRRDLFEPIRAHIREWRDRNGMTNADLNAAVGSKTNGCGMARHWTSTEGGQHAIPSKDQWGNLKRVLGWPSCELDRIYSAVKDGAERPVIGTYKIGLVTGPAGLTVGGAGGSITAPATPDAERWEGWGTALKPAQEPIILARKPLDGTVAANVLAHGVGGLNIDACRVATGEDTSRAPSVVGDTSAPMGRGIAMGGRGNPAGRWPANVLLDEHAAQEMDRQSGVSVSKRSPRSNGTNHTSSESYTPDSGSKEPRGHNDSGGASRFFPVFKYQAKAPKKERPVIEREDGTKVQHPTVKPLALMSWLVALITPPGGVVLDPFAGSGTTLEAARDKGFRAVGVEADAEHCELIVARLEKGDDGGLFAA